MRESKIEKTWGDRIKGENGLLLKFVSPGFNGVPDRLMLKPIPKHLQTELGKYFKFIEFKAPGKKPSPLQLRRHKELRKLGFTVETIDYA